MEEKRKGLTIDIVQTVHLLWRDKWMLISFAFVGAIVGIIIAFSIPSEYKTTVVLAPEENENGFSGSISSLASMVGMNLHIGSSGDAIYPEIYPSAIGSTDFIVPLFSVPVTTIDGDYTADYATYLTQHNRTEWWNYPQMWLGDLILFLKGDHDTFSAEHTVDPFHLTRPEWEIYKKISKNLTCKVDKKTNVITISVKDQDPNISACIADTVCRRLQDIITEYRTGKARHDVLYLEDILSQTQKQYVEAQLEYITHADSHLNTHLESANQKALRLKNEMELREQIYSTVAQQLQLAHAKVQERTPVFTYLQRASIPVKKSNTPKIFVMGLWALLGFLIRCGILAWRNKEMFL